MAIIDINAAKKWTQVSKEAQHNIVTNVFCESCKMTTIKDYSILDSEHGVLLEGLCKACDRRVARVVENM